MAGRKKPSSSMVGEGPNAMEDDIHGGGRLRCTFSHGNHGGSLERMVVGGRLGNTNGKERALREKRCGEEEKQTQ